MSSYNLNKSKLTLEQYAFLETEMLIRSKNKEAAWGLWAGLSFFGAHRFYTEDYKIGSAMLLTTIIPLSYLILVYMQLLSDVLFMPALFFLFGSVLWSWIDAFFLNRRIDSINRKTENEIIHMLLHNY